MRLKEEQIKRLAEKVYSDLVQDGLIVQRQERSAAVQGIVKAIMQDISREQNLARDAERMLDETIAAMGRGAADIDRRKMLRMIKEKLAKDRKIVL
ncbi:MAG: hypothetical protein A2X79_00610 [Desulfuromonadaceae bacterium GWB2_53_15]|nr:MAG: hypothetical protein A2X83_07075 [Desulfuromonadales bacterium GWD2_54_10]OHB32869.1 MAG: hypothetical protein A2X79_00610 [Desulfuromonadaceae bacterium GWB2_53_15]